MSWALGILEKKDVQGNIRLNAIKITAILRVLKLSIGTTAYVIIFTKGKNPAAGYSTITPYLIIFIILIEINE